MKTLIVSVAKTGHVNQCLAVCESLGWEADEVIRIPAPGRMTPWLERRKLAFLGAIAERRARPRTRSEPALRIVASGAASQPTVAAYRSLYGDDLFAVFTGFASWRKPIFDLALTPRHAVADRIVDGSYASPAARRTVLRRGVPVRSAPHTAGPRRGAFAMVGGTNKAFAIEPEAIAATVARMQEREDARPVVLTFSRRTPEPVEARLRAMLAPLGVAFIDRHDREGFERALAAAAEYVVTPDSLTMICEACDTGRPVRVFDLPCFDPGSTTAACVRDLVEGGEIAYAPDGEPKPQPPGGFRVSEAVRETYDAWLAQRG